MVSPGVRKRVCSGPRDGMPSVPLSRGKAWGPASHRVMGRGREGRARKETPQSPPSPEYLGGPWRHEPWELGLCPRFQRNAVGAAYSSVGWGGGFLAASDP